MTVNNCQSREGPSAQFARESNPIISTKILSLQGQDTTGPFKKQQVQEDIGPTWGKMLRNSTPCTVTQTEPKFEEIDMAVTTQ